MEPNDGFLVVRRQYQEDDGWNEGDVCPRARGTIAQPGIRSGRDIIWLRRWAGTQSAGSQEAVEADSLSGSSWVAVLLGWFSGGWLVAHGARRWSREILFAHCIAPVGTIVSLYVSERLAQP